MKVPWLAIVRSPPVWAVTIAHFTNNWGYYTLLTCLPTYLKKILHFDIKSVSSQSSSSSLRAGVHHQAWCHFFDKN